MRGVTRWARPGAVMVLLVAATASLVIPAPGGADSSGRVIAQGVLMDASSAPLAGKVTAYPSIAQDGPGLVQILGSASTDNSGHFTITANDPAALREAAAGNGGIANVSLIAAAGRSTGASFVPVNLGSGKVSSASAAPVGITVRAYPDPAAAGRPKGHAQCPPPGTVRTRVVKTWHHKPIVVGELNNAYRDNTHARWAYGRQADTFAQSGVRIGHKGWEISGGVSIHNSNSTEVAKRLAHRGSLKLRSNFVVKKGTGVYCDNYHHRHRSWGIAAHRWVGGLSQTHNHGLHRCPRHENYGPHTGFSRNSKNAVLWDRGFQAGPLTFGSRSGYSQWVKVHERFGHYKHHYICGQHGHSAVSSKRIFSGTRK
jgi:hypothetical protein